MAEAVLLPIAGAILEKLGSPLLQEIGLLIGLQDELENLSRTVTTIKAVLLDAENKYLIDNEVRVWLEMLKDAVYDADDLLDDFATEAFRRQGMRGNKITNEVRLFFSSSNKLAYSINMAHKIKNIRKKLDQIATNRKFHLSVYLVDPSLVEASRRQTHSSAPLVVIGREDDKKAILNLLLSDHSEDSVAVIPIVGFGGTGKTTLAQLVYKDQLVCKHFDMKLWVCVSDTFDVQLIVKKIIETATGRKPGDLDMETLKNNLCDIINGKKYLLVLDDIWNEDRRKWLDLNNLVIGGARGSRIMLTTRIMRVAEITSLVSPYELGGLSDDDSWELFQKMAFKQGHAPNKNFEVMGRDIVAKCAGLPLAIRTIGSLLYTKVNESEWQSFKDEELSKLDPRIDIVETLMLSYNHLPSHLKQCFAYCSLFPKDYRIHVPTLINYWKAQGYVCPKTKDRTGENLGLISFNYLLQRSFFQEVEESAYGDIKYCKMHDFMHDLAVSVARQESILGDSDQLIVTEKGRLISLNRDLRVRSQWQLNASLLQRRKPRTFIALRGFLLPEEQCHDIFCKLRCLRVLYLSYSGMNKVPSSIHQLKLLRYLDLSDNDDLEEVPNCITRLLNLQVLNLDRCRRLEQLPKDTMKLVNLIHLGLYNCKNLKHMPGGLGQLISLEVLSRFVLSKHTFQFNGNSGLTELHGLNNLSGVLEIKNLQYVKDPATECLAANLKGKPLLQILTLDWQNYVFNFFAGTEDGCYCEDDISRQEIALEALEPHTNLKELNIISYGGVKLLRWVSSLTNLVKIIIQYCNNCKGLPPLDKLPFLQDLTIGACENLEYIMNIKGGGGGLESSTSSLTFFPSLKQLWLRNCPNLKGWQRRTLTDASGSTAAHTSSSLMDERFACLSKLEIYNCPNLTWMPLFPSVENLTLQSCSKLLLERLLVKPPTSSNSPTATLSLLQHLNIGGFGDFGFPMEETTQNLATLKSLTISNWPNTRAMCTWIQHLTSLELLKFERTREMYLMEEEDEDNAQWQQQLQHLRSVEFSSCKNLKSLPKWLRHVSSLENLRIDNSPNLMKFPEWLANLASLQYLEVYECPQLLERCRNNMGADWSCIFRIPNIQIEFKWVQKNGRYVLS